MYHSLDKNGAFKPDERLELIDGEIYEMSPIGSRHSRIVKILNELLIRQFSDEFIISVQDPIALDDRSEPQPDLCILRRTGDYYQDELPKASDVHLLIEVADTSSGFDREKKIPRYSAAGIPETWLIDLESGHVEVHTMPKESAYGLVKIYLRGENAVSETFPKLNVPVSEILG
jgi:Uma2 family endonuclease